MSDYTEKEALDLAQEVLATPESSRQNFLESRAQGRIGLQERVQELVAASESAPEFPVMVLRPIPVEGKIALRSAGKGQKVGALLRRPPSISGPNDSASKTEQPGEMIGPYKLLQQIGEGGFGTVWMAQQTKPIRRKVAIKLIKRGMDTKQVIARFEAERQALALMDHPNIAKVHDGGETVSGRPYFVMELVAGVSVTEFCDRNRLDTVSRLRLFMQVCHAVHHAHQKGIIHRDLKPANVLVTLHDGTPVPKVIDFGIAKAIHRPLTEKTLFTELHAMIGSPGYMAPEQAELSGLDVDTRADIYALGVMLYELLTGTHPFEDLFTKAYLEMLRVIREENPPKPSTRISSLGERMTAIAERHQTAPKLLSRLVRGDLDWIPLKAMEKSRQRRYESASALAADVGRYLANEPVLATPPSVAYRARKLLRRHRAASVSTALILLALGGGLVATDWQRRRATTMSAMLRESLEASEQTSLELERALEDEQLQRTRATLLSDERQSALQESRRRGYLANLSAASLHRELGNLRAMKSFLDECEPARRGWEWRYLDARTDSAVQTLDHPGVCTVALLDGGRAISSRSAPRPWEEISRVPNLMIWNVETGSLLHELASDENATGPFAISANGRRIATITQPSAQVRSKALKEAIEKANSNAPGAHFPAPTFRNHVRVWELETRREICRLEAMSSVLGVVMSSDGQRVATYGDDHAVRIWRLGESTEPEGLRGHTAQICSLAMTPDGRFVVSGGVLNPSSSAKNRTICIWDADTSERLHALQEPGHSVSAVGISADGQRIVSGSMDGEVIVWDAGKGEVLARCAGHDSQVSAVSLSADGSRAYSVWADGTLGVWSSTSGKLIAELYGHEDGVHAIGVSQDGDTVVTGGGLDDTIRVWDIPLMLHDPVPLVRGVAVRDVVATPDGQRLLASSPSGIRVHDSATGDLLTTLPGPEFGMDDLAISADGRRMVSGGPNVMNTVTGGDRADRAVRVWDVEKGEQFVVLEGITAPARSVAISGDGALAACVTWGNGAAVWDVASGDRLTPTHETQETADWLGDATGGIVLTFDGSEVVTGKRDGTLRIHNVATGERRGVLSGHEGRVDVLVFSGDGQVLASGGRDGKIRLWDYATEALLVEGDTRSRILGLAWSKDGQRLLSISERALQVWDAATGSELLTLPTGDEHHLTAVAFLDDSRIVTSSESGLVVWSDSLGDMRDLAHRAARRDRVAPLVRSLFRDHVWAKNVVSALRSPDLDLGLDLRETAVKLAQERGDPSPARLNAMSWQIVRKPKASEGGRARALMMSRAATQHEPGEAGYITTLGAALFRSAEYEEALRVLRRADALKSDSPRHTRAVDLTFQAMCHYQLGARHEARRLLAEVDALGLKDAGGVRQIVREATTLIEGE